MWLGMEYKCDHARIPPKNATQFNNTHFPEYNGMVKRFKIKRDSFSGRRQADFNATSEPVLHFRSELVNSASMCGLNLKEICGLLGNGNVQILGRQCVEP